MFQKVLAQITKANRPHFDAIRHLILRDLAMQITSALTLCAICFWFGDAWVAVLVGALVLVSEFSFKRMFAGKFPFASWSKDSVLMVAMVQCTANSVVYLLPALFLVVHPSIAIKLTAVLWLLGVQIYLTNTFMRVPSFLYAMLIPAYVMTVLAFMGLSTSPAENATPLEWGICFGMLLLLIFSSQDTLREHVKVQAALQAAETESSVRLNKLTEAQRIDGLTGLLNRQAFDKSLSVMLEDRHSVGGEIAVFLIDLDSFKPINDTYTHEAGDCVLQATAARLEHGVGDFGIVGRMGGDEFVCALPDLKDEAEALAVARSLLSEIGKPIPWGERKLKVGANIGVAMTGPHEAAAPASVAALCSAADQAMYRAKGSPLYAPVLYESHLFVPRLTADESQALIDAISNRNLRPFYQPKVHLPTGRIIGFEALARWHHPDGRLRSPSEFVDQVNELGLQGEFMLSIAAQVMEDISAMQTKGLDPGQVSINVPEVALATLSGRQDLQALVEAHAATTKHLTFEITEDVFIARAAEVIQASISIFREMGVRVSLDDFGTGFASFHHLRQLDFDELKIDTSFVAGLGHDNTAEVLVQGFLNIASGIGVSVIAEGVETEDQRRDLINMGCMTAQGFLFKDAVPFEQASDLLTKQQAA